MGKKLVIFRPWDAMMDVRKLIADDLYHGFLRAEVDAVQLDLASPYLQSDFSALVNEGAIGCVVSLIQEPSFSIFRTGDGQAIENALKIPSITYSVDIPYLYHGRFPVQLHQHVITFMNKSQVKNFFKFILPDYKPKVVAFMPHAGIASGLEFTKEQYAGRSDRIFFVGSFSNDTDTSKPPWEIEPIRFFRDLMADAYSLLDANTDVDDAILKALAAYPVELDPAFLKAVMLHVYHKVYWYEHNQHRMNLLQYLMDSGHEIDFYGLGWPDGFASKYPNVRFFDGGLHVVETLKMFNNYKLTISPFWQAQGGHDRTFNALANGCQCLVYDSAYYRETFAGYKGLHYLGHKDFREDVERGIKAARRMDFAEVAKTRQYVLDHHTWASRAEYLLKLYELAKLEIKVEAD